MLADRSRVRLIGVNTPEMGREGAPDEPLAREARDALRVLLKRDGNQVSLRYDREKKDHYSRLLAHVYTANGVNLSAWLLEKGLATVLVVPPNLWNSECYQDIEEQARQKRRGLWARPEYGLKEAANLGGDVRGFHRLHGRVERTDWSRKSLWIVLEGRVSLRIDRDDLHYFPDLRSETLMGRSVIATGWLHPRRGRLQMRVRHPAAFQVLFVASGGVTP